jgi:hypothetical protein
MRQERLICLRRADPAVQDIEIVRLGGAAEVAHRRADLTGWLAYTGEHFFQVLEGGSLAIDHMMADARAERRHGPVRVVCQRAMDKRACDGWRFLRIDNLDLADAVASMQRAKRVDPCEAEQLASRLYRYAPLAP